MAIAGESRHKNVRLDACYLEPDGGEEEDRTPDLRIANAALSQLSYFPKISRYFSSKSWRRESSPRWSAAAGAL